MDYTPYYEIMRSTSLLRGLSDAELDTLMTCFAPRVRRYAKGELLLMAGYETHELALCWRVPSRPASRWLTAARW